MSAVKILFVSQKCGYFGGVEQNVADAAAGLRLAGHQCALAFADMTSVRAEQYAGQFSTHFACAELGADNAASIATILSQFTPDVVYLHKVPNLRALLPALQGYPTIMMVHDHDLCCPRRHKYFAWNGRVCQRAMGPICYADAAFLQRDAKGMHIVSLRDKGDELRAHHQLTMMLVGSTFMRDELQHNGFSTPQVRVLAPQVARPTVEPAPLPRTAEVLYVGQLVRGKGVDLLLRIMAQHVPDANLRIVGTGNAEHGLRALADTLGLQQRVQFIGWVDHDRLDTLYRSARVVAVPSRWPEPFGMVGLEAMSHARPLVAFAVGGIPDWLRDGKNGFLVSEQDLPAFGYALQRVLHDDELAFQLAAEGYRMYNSEYQFTDYIISLEKLFFDLARI